MERVVLLFGERPRVLPQADATNVPWANVRAKTSKSALAESRARTSIDQGERDLFVERASALPDFRVFNWMEFYYPSAQTHPPRVTGRDTSPSLKTSFSVSS